MAKQFKTYDGTIIEMPSHKHSVSDTVNAQGSTAIATQSVDGFMSKTDKATLDTMNTDIADIEEKLKYAVYLNVTQEDINLVLDSSGSKQNSTVYNNNGTVTVSDDIVISARANAIGTLTYAWTATWIYHGPNWTENEVIGTGYFTSNKTNTLSKATIKQFATSNQQPNSHMNGTVTVTNTVYGKTSTLAMNFTVDFIF